MYTCKECGASYPEDMAACPACGGAPVTDNPETEAAVSVEEPQIPKQAPKQVPKQYPKQQPKQQPKVNTIFEEKPQPAPSVSGKADVIVCPKCGSQEVYLMENRSPVEREKNVLMACTHCRRTFHGPAYYDGKIADRKKGVLFFGLMALLSLAGFAVLLLTGHLTSFLPGTILGGVTLTVSILGAILFLVQASAWKKAQASCYQPRGKGGKNV